ncbi:hypothetical protein KFK09_025283 [Dendrobium nobile]|uniref:Uncharacterized protein n=1 Tax=Dendrobium nobile TaxID=94219 RepID=A0A8T3AF06_DENNO|nr:hypothetical protein KFK09_025283 [Dendrobium nobile]
MAGKHWEDARGALGNQNESSERLGKGWNTRLVPMSFPHRFALFNLLEPKGAARIDQRDFMDGRHLDRRKAKEKANHLGFARFLQKDLALTTGLVVSPPPPPTAETPSSNSSSSTDELFVWPWVGMLVNLPMEDEGVLLKEQFSEFNLVNVISSHERDLESGKFEVMNEAISMNDVEKQVLHEKHYSYANTHDVAYWSKSFMLDLERTCNDHFKKRCWEIGLGFGFRVVAVDPNFRKLNIDGIVSAYRRSKSRAVLLDYDGMVIPQAAINKTPSAEVISILNTLCGDKKNIVFIVSGRGKDIFGRAKRLEEAMDPRCKVFDPGGLIIIFLTYVFPSITRLNGAELY